MAAEGEAGKLDGLKDLVIAAGGALQTALPKKLAAPKRWLVRPGADPSITYWAEPYHSGCLPRSFGRSGLIARLCLLRSVLTSDAQVLIDEGPAVKEKAWLRSNGGANGASVLGRTAFIQSIMQHNADLAFDDLASNF